VGISYVRFAIYNTSILLTVFCGFKTWSLTLREEHKLRFFGNGMMGLRDGKVRRPEKNT
jgi:hypothetical protein